MRKKRTKQELKALEKEMMDLSRWEDADHTVSFKGPTSVRFSPETLRKLHMIARIRKKPINRLVNEYVKSFVDSEYALVEELSHN